MLEDILSEVRKEISSADSNSSSKFANLASSSSKSSEYDKILESNKIRISVVGVGGAGSNCVTRLTNTGIQSANTIAVNTDAKHLHEVANAKNKILIGKHITRGLGAGGKPEIGAAAAESSEKELKKLFEDQNIVFVVAGMGGGTGSGGAPVIARMAKEQGAIVIGAVTYPFVMERGRVKIAQQYIKEMTKYADSVIVIDNNRLASYAPNIRIDQAFELADSIVVRAVRGISDTITFPSLLNIDYADVRAVMKDAGISMISVGEGHGVSKVEDAIRSTLEHPLLVVSYESAKGALIHIEGGTDMTLSDAVKIAEGISENFDPDSEVKLGARINPALKQQIYVHAIITGVRSPYILEGDAGIHFDKTKESSNDKLFDINEI